MATDLPEQHNLLDTRNLIEFKVEIEAHQLG